MTATGARNQARAKKDRTPLRVVVRRDVEDETSYTPIPLESARPRSDLVEGPKRWVLTTKHHIDEHCDEIEHPQQWSPQPACGSARRTGKEAG